ncbi:TetR/AcrR family transcriptional regulator [Brevibacterium sp. GP-SGM9]|uniref:TetR/AcrR family transcriptional regulator n=1 Tax=Brevibacterium sp. GP-SGM9 TaxID=3376990 RepID=UPI0039A67F76
MSRRDDIIAAAIRLTERSNPGEATLSVRAVAREAGVGASTLRHYFPTQADLHEEIARSVMDVSIKDFAITDSALDPGQRLFECCAQLLPNHEHRDLQLETWLTIHLNALGPERREVPARLLDHAHDVTYDCLRRWLDILASEGHLDPAEVGPASIALFTMLDGLALHSIITPDRITIDVTHEQLRWMIDRILHR